MHIVVKVLHCSTKANGFELLKYSCHRASRYLCSLVKICYSINADFFLYEGESISNQPIPFLMDWDSHDFMLCFNMCFIHGYKIAHVSSHSLIRYWMSNMASDAKACFSSKVEYRAVIGYLYLKGKTGKEIHGVLADVYGSSAPSYA